VMKSLEKVNLNGKIVLVREDLNSDVVNGKVLMSERIKQSAQTISYLKKRGARVVVIAHQGRPGNKDFTSLEQHARFLNKFVKIKFVDDIIGEKATREINNLKNGDAILLDNLRKLKDEFSKGGGKFVSVLSSLCDFYVNDAFSVSHREQASLVAFPKKMKSYAGPLLMKEVNALKKVSLKNCLYILAGAKPADNMRLMKGRNKVLACGLFGQMCVVARGKDLGKQEKYLQKNISNYGDSLKKLKVKLAKEKKLVSTPADFAVRDAKGKRMDLALEDFPSKFEIFDIGPATQRKFVAEIKKAKAIYMKGPAGYYSERQFFKGTNKILHAIAKSRAFSVLGGGQLRDAIDKSKIPLKKFGHVSLSGGALLDYIAGEKLPGLKALGFYRN